MPTSSARQHYRRQVKSSSCRGIRGRTCAKKPGCTYASKGSKRQFCRKSRNTRRLRRSKRLRR